jgi:phosphoribosylcarboxyaminoimidazole (NCAIR) mutase
LWLAKALEGGRVKSARYVPMPEGMPVTAVASATGEDRAGMVASDLMGS